MGAIVLQPRAKADPSEIWEFIADDSDEQADAFIDLIDQKIQLLAQQSGLGRRREELVGGLRGQQAMQPACRRELVWPTRPGQPMASAQGGLPSGPSEPCPPCINVQEAKTHLSALLARVAAGEPIVLARHGKPCARLVPLDPSPRRQLGFRQGHVDEA